MKLTLGETVRAYPYQGTTEDDYGNLTPAYGDPILILGCGWNPGTSSEPRSGGSVRVTVKPELIYPKSYSLTPQDRIERHGVRYEVEGYPEDWTHPMTGWDPGLMIVALSLWEG